MRTAYNSDKKQVEEITEQEYSRIHNEQIDFDNTDRIIVKVGSDLLDEVYINSLAVELTKMIDAGKKVVLVSSGAIKTAKEVVNLEGDSSNQGYAAIGQHMLMTKYAFAFGARNIAQTLFTDEDLGGRYPERYENARRTLHLLMGNKIIPIVNENDAVSVDEIKLGDNDRLSALVAKAVDADLLVMLSKHGLYDGKPGNENREKLINIVPIVDDSIHSFAGEESTGYGVGGMKTKIQAVGILEQKIPVIVMDGRNFSYKSIFDGTYQGTLFCRK